MKAFMGKHADVTKFRAKIHLATLEVCFFFFGTHTVIVVFTTTNHCVSLS
jgi:hypothetical protein